MDILPSIVGAALLGANVDAVAALVRGSRTQDAAVLAKLARRCAWSVGGIVLVSSAGLARAYVIDAPHGAEPADRAARLAMTMAWALNAIGMTVVGSTLPLVAACVLTLRRTRATRTAM